MYDADVTTAHRSVSAQYRAAGKTPPNLGAETIADKAAKRAAEQNMNIYLRDAVEATAQNMRTDIQRAAMQAAQDAVTKGQAARQLQRNLIAELERKGIASISYVRNGQTCYMQLDTYAELIARTTPHEIRNTVNISLGTRIGNDLVMVSEHWGACPICTPYQGRVFSTSGTNPNYPYLYSTPFSSTYQNFHH